MNLYVATEDFIGSAPEPGLPAIGVKAGEFVSLVYFNEYGGEFKNEHGQIFCRGRNTTGMPPSTESYKCYHAPFASLRAIESGSELMEAAQKKLERIIHPENRSEIEEE